MIRILIDGYNFLNHSGIESPQSGPTRASPLVLARQALLDFLVAHLTPEQARETVVVFDAHFPSANFPAEATYRGITVKFALRYPDADSLLEQLIQEHTAPKELLVVSSDHRIQRAARRRRAKFIDSDKWYRNLISRRPGTQPYPQQPGGGSNEDKRAPDLEEISVQQWMEMMGLEDGDNARHEDTAEDAQAQFWGKDGRGAEPTSQEQAGKTHVNEPGTSQAVPALPAVETPNFGFSDEELTRPIEVFEDETDAAKPPRLPGKHRSP